MHPTDARLDRLAQLIGTSPHNLVSAGQRGVASLRVHLEESLAVGSKLDLAPGQRWLDLGTGGGIPGLVLAMQHPAVDWVLLDSVEKKVGAVREFAGALTLGNVHVVSGRAEEAACRPGMRASFDGVVARAVAPLVVLVELARGFVRSGGLLVAVKGSSWEAEVADAAWAMGRIGWIDVRGERVEDAQRPTWLVTMSASGPVPDAVPRRPGVISRRPLRPRAPERGA